MMIQLNKKDVEQVGGGSLALDAAEAFGAAAMGGIAGVVASAFLTPAGGALVGIGVSDVVGLGFAGINYLLE